MHRRISGSLVALTLTTATLSGCGMFDSGPDPAESAQELAAALETGDVADVAFAGTTPDEVTADLERIIGGLADARPTVEVGDAVEADDGGTATATLAWSWTAYPGWTYETSVDLTEGETDGEEEWQVEWAPTVVHPDLTAGASLDVTRLQPQRADILGAGGTALVTDRPVLRLGIDKTKVADAAALPGAAQALAQVLDVDAAAYTDRVVKAGPQAFVEAITLRLEDVPAGLDAQLEAIPGAVGFQSEQPLTPSRGFAAELLGTVGEVTAEMVEKDPAAYQPGDVAGLSGLQARYDAQLRGTPGWRVEVVADDGTRTAVAEQPATDGQPLELTLDPELQTAAESALPAGSAAIVALRPSDGAILAAANSDGTDGYNIATFGQAAPGSTFKIASALALLRAGRTPDTTVPCTTEVTVDGKRFENYDDYPASAIGEISLREAIANSCNTAMISQHDQISDSALAEAAASLGLGIDHDRGFPAYFGQVPPPASTVEKAADLIGQGKVLASPMAMATVIASVQAGTTVVPTLVPSVPVTPAEGAAPLTPAETEALRSMLRAVVTDGSGAALADVPGEPVIAKTGTAEFERDGQILLHAWMVAAQGDLAVAVYVEEGESGSGTAGPIIEEFLRAAR